MKDQLLAAHRLLEDSLALWAEHDGLLEAVRVEVDEHARKKAKNRDQARRVMLSLRAGEQITANRLAVTLHNIDVLVEYLAGEESADGE